MLPQMNRLVAAAPPIWWRGSVISEQTLREFQATWPELEVEVVGMVQTEDGSWTAADGVNKTPRTWDAIVLGRNPNGSTAEFDILELVEDVPKRDAVAAARQAAKILKISSHNIVIR